MSGRRRAVSASLVLLLAAGLAACAPPDPRRAAEEAAAVFDELVTAAGSVDTAVLRTLELDEPARLACDRPADSTQTAYIARGTLAVEAGERDAATVEQAVASELAAGDGWERLRATRTAQSAWIDERGIVVTVTADGPAVAIAVFTPCMAAG